MQVLKFKRKPPAPPRRGKVFRSLADELNGVPGMPPERLNTDFRKEWDKLEEALVWVFNRTDLREFDAKVAALKEEALQYDIHIKDLQSYYYEDRYHEKLKDVEEAAAFEAAQAIRRQYALELNARALREEREREMAAAAARLAQVREAPTTPGTARPSGGRKRGRPLGSKQDTEKKPLSTNPKAVLMRKLREKRKLGL